MFISFSSHNAEKINRFVNLAADKEFNFKVIFTGVKI